MSSSNAVEAHDLVKDFGDTRAVDGVSLAVPTGKGRQAKGKRYSACMTFPNDQPTTVYAGAAAWVGPGPSSEAEEGAPTFQSTSIELMGLRGSLAAK